MATEAIRVITGKVMLSFPHLFEPHSFREEQEAKYSVCLLIPKDTREGKETLQKLRDAEAAAIKQGVSSKWGGKKPRKLGSIIRDGDEEMDLDDYPEFAGHWYLTVTNKMRPAVVDKNKHPILDPEDVYGGCFARASLDCFPYSAMGNNGVTFWVRGVQKVEDGERLGGGGNAVDDFDDEYADDDYDADDII